MWDYERLKKIGIPMPELYEADIPNERILKEYIAGDTIAVLASRGEVKPDYLDQVRRIQPVDMFPHTNHVETVCLMSRKEK